MVAQAQRKKLRINIGPQAVSPAFLPYLRSNVRHLLLWGGRDSTKSDFVALKLLLDAMQLPYFCCILIREKQNTIADSQIATLKKVAQREGLLLYFKFPEGPTAVLEVKCLLNGNRFIGRGTDDMDRVKSVSDPTHVWYEEANQIDGADAEVVSTTLRTSRPGAVIQEVYTFNPDHDGDYKTFWIWQKFFEANGHDDDTTFGGHLAVDVNGELINVPYQVVHSTYRNNPWCPPERAATYEAYGRLNPITGKMADEYRYRVWCRGLWAIKQTGNEFYNDFDLGAHVKPTPYVDGLPILTSWDANALPYCHMLMCQPQTTPDGLVLRFFGEYALAPPKSGLKNTATQFLLDRTARGWASSSVFLTGDSTLRNRKIGEESGSLFDDVVSYTLPALHSSSTDLWPKKNANVMRRRDFLNAVFRGAIPGIRIQVDPDACPYLLADFGQVQTGVEGKVKPKVKDKAMGTSYEKLGHASDNFDYSMLSHPVVAAAYEQFKAGRDG